ncbi:MAG: hypothetical protein J6N72_10910 [Psychrobacter sp.]|nr:hypothetical protein [Psychrobacter sp.]
MDSSLVVLYINVGLQLTVILGLLLFRRRIVAKIVGSREDWIKSGVKDYRYNSMIKIFSNGWVGLVIALYSGPILVTMKYASVDVTFAQSSVVFIGGIFFLGFVLIIISSFKWGTLLKEIKKDKLATISN